MTQTVFVVPDMMGGYAREDVGNPTALGVFRDREIADRVRKIGHGQALAEVSIDAVPPGYLEHYQQMFDRPMFQDLPAALSDQDQVHVVMATQGGFAREDAPMARVVGVYRHPELARRVKMCFGGYGATVETLVLDHVMPGYIAAYQELMSHSIFDLNPPSLSRKRNP